MSGKIFGRLGKSRTRWLHMKKSGISCRSKKGDLEKGKWVRARSVPVRCEEWGNGGEEGQAGGGPRQQWVERILEETYLQGGQKNKGLGNEGPGRKGPGWLRQVQCKAGTMQMAGVVLGVAQL